ncbi:MAG: Ig-like domain-containing protein [Prevotellaceae bacterium]|nr:Ig-like domain-containing protein [Prevotellaceae bacterium]
MKLSKDNKWIACLLTAIAIYGLLTCIISGCANSSIAPTGGPKDTLSPVLLKMIPPQRTRGFKGKEVVFTFNEYVQLKDQNKNFVISPPLPSKKPALKIRGKSIVVSFPSLADSVTYYIDFGTSVVDVNENNPANYLNYIFSTGDVLDTMIYAGHVVDAFTLEPVAAAHIFLYEENTDSIVFKRNPSALSITNKEGVFIVKGLKNKKYKLVAVTDKNSNMRYDAGIEQIAFPDSLIQPGTFAENDSISFESLPVFNLFTENVKRQALMETKRPEERLISLRFNEIYPVIKSFKLDDVPVSRIIEETSYQKDTVNFWITSREIRDTLTGELIYLKTDTLNNLSPDTVKIKLPYSKPKPKRKNKDEEAEEEEIIPIEPNIHAGATAIVEHDITLAFKTPLIRVDTSKIRLSKFDAGKEKTPVNIASITQDSIRLTNYRLSAKWEVASRYELVILPEAFVDIYSITNDTVTKTFETADPEKFGKLIIEIINSDKQYILHLMKEKDKKVFQEKIADGNGKIVFQYLNAGKYRIRLIEDLNRNGKWDTGNYMDRKQPERVLFIVFSTEETSLEIKTNREDEQTIDASILFDKDVSPLISTSED